MQKISVTASVFSLLFALITGSAVMAEETAEGLERHIFDFANLLPDDQEWIEKDLKNEAVDIIVVTVPSLEGSLAKKHTHAVNKVWDTKKKTSGTIAIILSVKGGLLEITRTADLDQLFNWSNIQNEAVVNITSSQTPSEIIVTALDIIRNNAITSDDDDPYGGDITGPPDQEPDSAPEVDRPSPFPPLEDEGEIEPVHFKEGQHI